MSEPKKDKAMPKKMFSWLAQPYIYYTSKGIQKTSILFAIFDKVEVAWYMYDENSREFNIAEMYDLENNDNDISYSRFAGKINSGHGFVPKKVTRAGEFANGLIKPGPITSASARLSLHRIGGDHIQIYMNLYLKTGPQLIEFLPLKSENPMDLPANHEWGRVSLLEVEKRQLSGFGSVILDPSKIRDLSSTMRLRLYHPKLHAK